MRILTKRSRRLFQGTYWSMWSGEGLTERSLRSPLLRSEDRSGMVMTLLDMNVEDRDPSLSEAACMMALATIVTERHVAPSPSIVTTSTTPRALLNDIETPLASDLPTLHRS